MLKEKIEALKALLGGDDDLVKTVLEKAEQTQKAAEEAGIEFKGEDPQPESTPQPVTEKAEVEDLTELADQETLEELADEVSEVELEPVIGDMTPEEFSGMMAEALAKALEPHVKEISKLKVAQSQKDDEAASLKEALTLQAQTITALKAQLDELTGSQPRAATKGYRASQAEETVVNKSTSRVAGQKPTVDPGFLDFAIGPKP